MLASAVEQRGPRYRIIDDVFSVDVLKTFKTDPAVYDHGHDGLQALPRRGIVPVVQPLGCCRSNQVRLPHRSGSTAPGMPDEYRDLSPSLILPDLNGVG
jgi:2-haloacid dehalogenase